MAVATWMIAAQVAVLDQAVHVIAQRHVTLLDERWVTPWLALLWETVHPGRPMVGATYLMWMGVSLAVIAALAVMIRRRGAAFAPLQAFAFGALLGGTASHLIDLLRWGHVLTTLHLSVPAWHFDSRTGIAEMAQWAGMLALGLQVVVFRRRRSD